MAGNGEVEKGKKGKKCRNRMTEMDEKQEDGSMKRENYINYCFMNIGKNETGVTEYSIDHGIKKSFFGK